MDLSDANMITLTTEYIPKKLNVAVDFQSRNVEDSSEETSVSNIQGDVPGKGKTSNRFIRLTYFTST